MPWFKIDDAFHGHPKVMELSPAAVGIWTLSGTWCANYLTDGEIKGTVVSRFGGTPEMIRELVESGLWIDNGGTYHFKDWEDYQPMKADVEAEREAARERMRAARAKKKGIETSPEQPPSVQPNNSGTSEEVRVTPAQPGPTQPTLMLTPWEEFWDAYPKKKGIGDAERAWGKAIAKVAPEVIMRGLISHLPEWAPKESRFIPNPSTWLNQERWADEIEPSAAPKKNPLWD